MHLDKSAKRIQKRVKRGFKGYPMIHIAYLGPDDSLATKAVVDFIAEEGAEAQQQIFETKTDVRQDEVVQTTIIKIIDRTEAKTVTLAEGVQTNA